jgi:hypothetical protein
MVKTVLKCVAVRQETVITLLESVRAQLDSMEQTAVIVSV